MADLATLQAQRAQILKEIERRGGAAKAPGFAAQLKDVEAQIRTARAPTAGTNPPAPQMGPPELQTKDYQNPNELFQDEVKVADYGAGKQIAYSNPNTTTPLGSSTTTLNPDGTVSVDQKLSGDQQNILDQDSKLSQMGRQLAIDRLGQSGFGQEWNPNFAPRQWGADQGPSGFNPSLTARTTTGDMVADRRRIEDQVFQNLTRNLQRDKGEEMQQLEQTLHNRGVPLDPNNPLYAKAVRDLNERYDSRESQARGQAVEMGGNEFGRSVGIQEQLRSNDYGQALGTHQQGMGDLGQRFGMQEQQRATDFGQDLAARQQGFSETSALAGFGQGLMMPNLPGYQAPNYQLPNPTDMYTAYHGVQQGQQAIDLQKKQLAAQTAIARMAGGGGGGGGSSAQQAPNPFNGL